MAMLCVWPVLVSHLWRVPSSVPSKTRWPQPVNAVVTASKDPLRFEGITGRLAFVSLICMESDTLELHDNQMKALLVCYSFKRLAATCLESGPSRRAIGFDWGDRHIQARWMHSHLPRL